MTLKKVLNVTMIHLAIALLFVFLKSINARHQFLEIFEPPIVPFSFYPPIHDKSNIEFQTKNDAEKFLTQTTSNLQDVRQHIVENPDSLIKPSIENDNEAQQKSQKLENSIEGISQGSTTKLLMDTASDESPKSPDPQEEKDLKARTKGGFMSDKASSAAESFSNANIQTGGIGADQSIRDNKKEILKAIADDEKPEKINSEDIEELIGLEEPLNDTPSDILRDYSVQCPEEFFAVSTVCLAKNTYKGPCAPIQKDLYKLPHTAKATWAKSCGAQWPSLPKICDKGTDYNHACPVGWVNLGNGICQNPNKYNSRKCSTKINFNSFSEAQKQEFEKRCNLRWPCRTNICEKNFNLICPSGWKHLGKFLCKAPSTYTGSCNRIENMIDTVDDEKLKINFELKCSVEWPCFSYSCDRNFEAICPLGWSKLEDNSCKAPFTFISSEKCPNIINFSNFKPEVKESLAAICQLDFPCKDRKKCEMDFYSRCPVDWIDLGDGKMCQAPKDYDGRCDTIMNFADLSKEQKKAKTIECSIQWPCFGEWRYNPFNVNLQHMHRPGI